MFIEYNDIIIWNAKKFTIWITKITRVLCECMYICKKNTICLSGVYVYYVNITQNAFLSCFHSVFYTKHGKIDFLFAVFPPTQTKWKKKLYIIILLFFFGVRKGDRSIWKHILFSTKYNAEILHTSAQKVFDGVVKMFCEPNCWGRIKYWNNISTQSVYIRRYTYMYMQHYVVNEILLFYVHFWF